MIRPRRERRGSAHAETQCSSAPVRNQPARAPRFLPNLSRGGVPKSRPTQDSSRRLNSLGQPLWRQARNGRPSLVARRCTHGLLTVYFPVGTRLGPFVRRWL